MFHEKCTLHDSYHEWTIGGFNSLSHIEAWRPRGMEQVERKLALQNPGIPGSILTPPRPNGPPPPRYKTIICILLDHDHNTDVGTHIVNSRVPSSRPRRERP